MARRVVRVLVVVAVALGGLSLGAAGAEELGPRPADGTRLRPIVFVHGFSGSGAQFETQALRFAGNGYPVGHIAAHEYDSLLVTETRDDVYARLDMLVDDLLRATRADRIDLLGHSMGTGLMQGYLNSSAERAARVAHYVNLDGSTAAALPGGVPTLAVWGAGSTARQIVGATNVYFSDQTHTQVVTSEETFAEIYEFFTGEEPATTDIVPTPSRRLRLAGRALTFPQNIPVTDATLEIYEVRRATGARIRTVPDATFELTGDGSWGPFNAWARRRYEFALVREGAATHHIYFAPFLRNDPWVRLLTSPPEGGIADLVETGDHHAAITIARYKEWWGDQGAGSDVLEINGVNILNAANTPIGKRAIAIFAHDRGSDGVTDLATPIPAFAFLPFITGIDVFMPATSPPSGTISIASTPRGGGGRVETLNVPDWPSSTDGVSVHFNDYLQD